MISRSRRIGWVVCVWLLACSQAPSESIGKPARDAATPAVGEPSAGARPDAGPGTRRALLIGINEYLPATPANGSPSRWRNLAGAVPDVRAMRELLVSRYGFAPGEILTLTDKAATRQAILRGIEEHLIRLSREGDVTLFYFSGHGSQVRNLHSDEPDLLDESLIPADSHRGAPDIRDKELRRLFNQILDRGATLTVILDSCHSGSGARDLSGSARARRLDPPLQDVKDGAPAGPRPEDRGALVLSASQDHELAWETSDQNGEPHGAFSLALFHVLRNLTAGESAEETFARVRARLQAEKRFQEPVLAGIATVRQTPLLGGNADRFENRTVVAVERMERDGTVILQGGWAHGLTVGSELRILDKVPGTEARLEVTRIRDLSRCEARFKQTAQRSAPVRLQEGTLTEVVGWVAPPDGPMQAYLPVLSGNFDPILALAREMSRKAPERGIRWILDPTETAPTHLLLWRERGQAESGWELLDPEGNVQSFGTAASTEAILAKLTTRPASIFLQLPAPAPLARSLVLGPGTDHSAVEVTNQPEEADYVLTGRLAEGGPEYAWVRSHARPEVRRRTAMPLRTDWHRLGSLEPPDQIRATGRLLEEAVLRLRKIQAWQQLESPPAGASPYELAVRRESDRQLISQPVLTGQERYELFLRARRTPLPDRVESRYIYIFMIDTYGRSVLLFPVSGPVENLLPIPHRSSGRFSDPPTEVFLGRTASFHATPPYGVDTYFLLTTDEPLGNPWILEWDGVRTRGPLGESPLEELLSVTGGSLRSASPSSTPATWSLERKFFEAVPPVSVEVSSP